MDFDRAAVDPEIEAKHKAVYNDLFKEIDALESDEEEEEPQPKPVKSKPSGNKKDQVLLDDDFPKFDNKAFSELQNDLKVKNNFADLEKDIDQLESDEEDGAHSSKKKPQQSPTKTKPAAEISESSSKKPALVPGGLAADSITRSNAQNAGVSIPFSYFTGSDPKKMVAIDNKFHGKDCLMTLRLAEYEIQEIIDPCLDSSSIASEIKTHLEAKKKSLVTFKNNIESLFKKGSLDPAKYLQIISKMKEANIKVAKDLQSANATKESERVRERLKIIVSEENEFSKKSKGEPGNSMESSKSDAPTKKKAPSSEPAKFSAVSLPTDLDNLSLNELFKILKKRKNEYYNLAVYINKDVLKHLEGNENAQKKQYIQTVLLPLIQKANQNIEACESGAQDTKELVEFLNEELVEMRPQVLHGKSLEERSQDLQNLAQQIETCMNEETDYVNKMKATLSDPNQPMGATGRKIKESEKAIEKYAEYIEQLSKLDSDKFMWVPTPKVVISKEQRMITLMNQEIPGNSLIIKFTKLEHIKARPYWIRWGIETANGYVTYNSSYCSDPSLVFNYQQMVKLTNNEKLDQNIEKKEIRVEVLFKQLFMEKKKGEATISLTPLRKTNTYEGKIKVRDDGIELGYVLQVREPLIKHTKLDVTTVHSFQLFPPFNKDTPVPQTNSASQKKNTDANGKGPSPKVVNQEEKKVQEPAQSSAASGGGGGKLFEKKKYPPLVLLPQANDPLANLSQEEIPQGVTMEQVKDPSNPEIIDCLKVLNMLATELEKARPALAAEGRRSDNKIVSDNWSKALKKATIIQAKFENGDIEPNDYVQILKTSIERDKKLIILYKAKGDESRLAFIEEKMKFTTEEFKELEEALASQAE